MPEILVSANWIIGLGSQLSVAVGLAGAGIPSQGTVTLPGMPLSTGGVVSFTRIICLCLPTLPQLSVAVHSRSKV